MDIDRIFIVKELMKKYLSDKEGFLDLITRKFNIEVDESRLEDYTIINTDLDTPKVELYDKKTNTTYISEYIKNNIDRQIYIKLTILMPTYKLEKLYNTGRKYPIMEKATFDKDEFSVVCERNFDYHIDVFIHDSVDFSVKLLKRLNCDGKEYTQRLLTKKSENNFTNDTFSSSFDQVYTYGHGIYVKENGGQNKCTYIINDNTIYKVRDHKQKDNGVLRGICFENTNEDLTEYFPDKMDINDYPILKEKETTSAMIFSGFQDEAFYSLEIYKNDGNAIIKYHIKENETDNLVENHEFVIPLINPDIITIEEIHTIIASLQNQFNGDKFIDSVLQELLLFSNKINYKMGIYEDENDILNPKLLINQNFDETARRIDENKEEAFKLILNQFKE